MLCGIRVSCSITSCFVESKSVGVSMIILIYFGSKCDFFNKTLSVLLFYLYQKQSDVIGCKMRCNQTSEGSHVFIGRINVSLCSESESLQTTCRRYPLYFSCSSSTNALVHPMNAYIMKPSFHEICIVEALESMLLEALL